MTSDSPLEKAGQAILPGPPDSLGLDPDYALRKFFKDQEWTVKTGIGGIFNAMALGLFCLVPLAFPISVCLIAIVQGYSLRVLRTYIRDKDAPLPPWNEWFDLFVSGMSWIALTTMYFFMVMFFAYVSLAAGSLVHATKTVDPNFVVWAGSTMIGIKVMSAFFHFFTSVLMANFADEESMPAGFAFIKVVKRIVAAPGDFVCAWIIGIGIQSLFFFVPCLTLIGIFLLPTTIFTSQLLSAKIMAQAWRSSEAEIS